MHCCHSANVASNRRISLYRPNRAFARLEKLGVNTYTIKLFLEEFSEIIGGLDPSGRGNTDDNSRRIFPSSTTKKDLYNLILDEYKIPVVGSFAAVKGSSSLPTEPPNYPRFCNIWNKICPYIKISPTGSDLNDTCTRLQNDTNCPAKNSEVFENEKALRDHEETTMIEKIFYLDRRKDSDYLHFIMDFAEKVLLPSFMNQPGKLHFLSGLKNDIFCISCAINNTKYIFNLPEGHWPVGKNPNEVLSMVYDLLVRLKSE